MLAHTAPVEPPTRAETSVGEGSQNPLFEPPVLQVPGKARVHTPPGLASESPLLDTGMGLNTALPAPLQGAACSGPGLRI